VFVNWVNETPCVRKPMCGNPDNPTGKCVYKYCPKVLNKQTVNKKNEKLIKYKKS
jgi:hypothetical protein